MKSTRQLVYDTLVRVLYEDAYSNLALDQAIREAKMEKRDAAFAAALFYGVLERGSGLDYSIARYLKKGIASLDREVHVILRMGFYQLCFMDSVPDGAAVDESVRLAAYARKTSAKGLVNAVLRAFSRDGKQLFLPEGGLLERCAVEYSCPRPLLDRIAGQYGEERAVEYAKASLNRPPIFARVNTLKTTPEKLIGWLEARGVTARICPEIEDCLLLEDTGSIDRLPQYRQGLFHVQDISSQLCVRALDPQPGETICDVCAAPGSKSFTAAQRMNGEGTILAFDLHEARVGLIAEGAKRLGISIIQAGQHDATRPFAPPILADRVLCDVPCSGLGVIRRKPEIKYRAWGNTANRELPEREQLPALQYRILVNAAACVKPGGKLIYSTCTLDRNENEAVVEHFLSENNSFKPLQLPQIFCKIEKIDGFTHTTWPTEGGGDGFFVALLQRDEVGGKGSDTFGNA